MPTITEPKYMTADNSIVDVLLDGVPFSAMPTDPEPYGQQIYADAVAGVYGPVQPYVPPLEPVFLPASAARIFSALAKLGHITNRQAIDAAAHRSLPENIRHAISCLPAEEEFEVEMYMATTDAFAPLDHKLRKALSFLTNEQYAKVRQTA